MSDGYGGSRDSDDDDDDDDIPDGMEMALEHEQDDDDDDSPGNDPVESLRNFAYRSASISAGEGDPGWMNTTNTPDNLLSDDYSSHTSPSSDEEYVGDPDMMVVDQDALDAMSEEQREYYEEQIEQYQDAAQGDFTQQVELMQDQFDTQQQFTTEALEEQSEYYEDLTEEQQEEYNKALQAQSSEFEAMTAQQQQAIEETQQATMQLAEEQARSPITPTRVGIVIVLIIAGYYVYGA